MITFNFIEDAIIGNYLRVVDLLCSTGNNVLLILTFFQFLPRKGHCSGANVNLGIDTGTEKTSWIVKRC